MISRSALLAVLFSMFAAALSSAAEFDVLIQPELAPCVATVPAAPIFSTIQAAVNAAGSGQTIGVCVGTYPENVVVGTAGVTIRAVSTASVVGPGDFVGVAFHVTAPDVTIHGLEVSGFEKGVLVEADRATVRANELHGNRYGVAIEGGSGSRVIANTIHDNPFIYDYNFSYGVAVIGGAGHEIANNVVSGCALGISVEEDTGGVDIHHNTVLGSFYEGISVSGSHSTVRKNNLRRNGGDGIFVWGASDLTIDGNTVIANNTLGEGYHGIHVAWGSRCIVRNNIVAYNPATAIYAYRTQECVFTRNSVYRNWYGGIRSEESQGGDQFACNAARFNGGHDCYWDESDSPSFTRNLCLT